MSAQWPCDEMEKTRRMIDLATISVLLDAGAGDNWKYIDRRGIEVCRSEGLASASLDMFCDGLFSSDVALPHRVNGTSFRTPSKAKAPFA